MLVVDPADGSAAIGEDADRAGENYGSRVPRRSRAARGRRSRLRLCRRAICPGADAACALEQITVAHSCLAGLGDVNAVTEGAEGRNGKQYDSCSGTARS